MPPSRASCVMLDVSRVWNAASCEPKYFCVRDVQRPQIGRGCSSVRSASRTERCCSRSRTLPNGYWTCRRRLRRALRPNASSMPPYVMEIWARLASLYGLLCRNARLQSASGLHRLCERDPRRSVDDTPACFQIRLLNLPIPHRSLKLPNASNEAANPLTCVPKACGRSASPQT